MNTYLLHIETATKVCSVALSLNGVLVANKETHSDQFVHGEKLNLFIIDVLKEARIDFYDLAAISISSGPGSYTGLRIGVSSAKGFCYGLGIPLISIPTLESYYSLASDKYTNQGICVMIDARRMEVYSQIWNENGALVKSLSADVLDQNTYLKYTPFVCVGDGCDKMVELWNRHSVRFDTKLYPSAIGQIKMAYFKFLSKDFENMAEFIPNYLKDFHSTAQSK
jgi:tRNA threonylcarbamoyladenosine biosynthesis protein TsaB